MSETNKYLNLITQLTHITTLLTSITTTIVKMKIEDDLVKVKETKGRDVDEDEVDANDSTIVHLGKLHRRHHYTLIEIKQTFAA